MSTATRSTGRLFALAFASTSSAILRTRSRVLAGKAVGVAVKVGDVAELRAALWAGAFGDNLIVSLGEGDGFLMA